MVLKNGEPTLVELVKKYKSKKIKGPVLAGVAVIVFKDVDQILLGQRKGSHGEGEWALPGGRLEPGEDPAKCAIRELEEETGIKKQIYEVDICRSFPFSSTITGGEPWLTLYYVTDNGNQEPKLMEPDKCFEWKWFFIDDLPKPLFEATKVMVKNIV